MDDQTEDQNQSLPTGLPCDTIEMVLRLLVVSLALEENTTFRNVVLERRRAPKRIAIVRGPNVVASHLQIQIASR